MERKLLLNPILEHLPLLQRQAIRLRNDRYDIHRLAELLQHHDIDRLECVASWSDEIQTAVDSGVLNVPLSLRCQLFAKVSTMLVFDVLDDGIPAAVVVDAVAVAWGVYDVEAETHAILFEDVGDGVDFGGLTHCFGWGKTAFAVDEVGGEDCVDEGGFAETGLA